ncbi:TRAP transporter small permease [Thermodesulfobacteriota bacterium]
MVIVKAEKYMQQVEKYQTIISWVAALFITFMIVIDVFLRFVFNAPLPATWEMSEVIMPYIVFFAFSYTLTRNGHVRVTMFVELLPAKARFWCDVFRIIVSIGMCALFTYWSWLRFWEAFLIKEEILAAIYIPWFVGKFAMPIGMATISIRYLLQLHELFSDRKS